MLNFTVSSMSEFYETVIPILNEANPVSCRGMETKEVTGVHFCLTNPRSRLVWIAGRRLSLPFAITEALMLVNESDEVKHIAAFNKNMIQFSDDGLKFHGSYGKRIAEHVPLIIQKLIDDPTTRQAVLTIHKVEDSTAKTKDVPCTLGMQFIIRDGKLDLHVYMRSNDAIWGTPYDVFNFTMLQEVVANTVGCELGSYYHSATSLHVYEKHYKLLENLKHSLRNGNCYDITVPCGLDYLEYKAASDLLVHSINSGKELANMLRFKEENWPLNVLAVVQSGYKSLVKALVPYEMVKMVTEYFEMNEVK